MKYRSTNWLGSVPIGGFVWKLIGILLLHIISLEWNKPVLSEEISKLQSKDLITELQSRSSGIRVCWKLPPKAAQRKIGDLLSYSTFGSILIGSKRTFLCTGFALRSSQFSPYSRKITQSDSYSRLFSKHPPPLTPPPTRPNLGTRNLLE